MESKHTPGPWHVGGIADSIVYAADGFAVANANVYHNSHGPHETGANARLIAAAPDMLAALEAIEARISGIWDNPALVAFGPLSTNTDADCLAIARAAIAKAKGD